MDEEREAYEESLARFNATNVHHHSNSEKKALLKPVLGISLTSSYIRLSYYDISNNGSMQQRGPFVVENLEGSRKTPCFVLYNDDDDNDDEYASSILLGQMAKSKFHERNCNSNIATSWNAEEVSIKKTVINPQSLLLQLPPSSTAAAAAEMSSIKEKRKQKYEVIQYAYQDIIRNTALDALYKVAGGNQRRDNATASTSKTNADPIFGSGHDMYNVQPIVTIPPSFFYGGDSKSQPNYHSMNEKLYLFIKSINTLSDNLTSEIICVPEPIAAITAAQQYNLLEEGEGRKELLSQTKRRTTLVIDIGSDCVTTSLVASKRRNNATSTSVNNGTRNDDNDNSEHELVYHSVCPNVGVDVLIQGLVHLMVHNFYGFHPLQEKTNKTLYEIVYKDGMALQRLYNAAEDALLQLSGSKNRNSNQLKHLHCQISIPFLSIDLKTREPRHLQMSISLSQLETEVTNIILSDLSSTTSWANNNNDDDDASISTGVELPKKTSTIADIMSFYIMDVLEKSKESPYTIRGIILCGDGGRSLIYQNAIRNGLANIMGENHTKKLLIIPNDDQIEELAVLGGAIIGKRIQNKKRDLYEKNVKY